MCGPVNFVDFQRKRGQLSILIGSQRGGGGGGRSNEKFTDSKRNLAISMSSMFGDCDKIKYNNNKKKKYLGGRAFGGFH